MVDVGVARDGIEQQRTMALGRLALITKKGAWLFQGQFPHLFGLNDGLGQLELVGVDPL